MSEHNVRIHDAFIVLGSTPIQVGFQPQPGITGSTIYGLGDYVPRWARRPGLRRLRPYVRRIEAVRSLWHWTEDKRGASAGISYPYLSESHPKGERRADE